jgi:hypothetical protein
VASWLLYSGLGLGALVIFSYFTQVVLRWSVHGDAFFAQIQKLIVAGKIDRAIKLCNVAASAALPRVVKAGLTRANRDSAARQTAVSEASLEVLGRLRLVQYRVWLGGGIAIACFVGSLFVASTLVAVGSALLLLVLTYVVLRSRQIRFDVERYAMRLLNLLNERGGSPAQGLGADTNKPEREGIFLCYRRSDEPFATEAVYQRLRRGCGSRIDHGNSRAYTTGCAATSSVRHR